MLVYIQKNTEQKVESLKEIKNVLDVDNSYEKIQYQEKKKGISEYVESNKEEIANIWCVRLNKGEITQKAVIGCLQQIFGSWIGSNFKRGERNKKQTNGAIEDVSNFEVSPMESIVPFIDNQKEAIEQYKKINLRKIVV